MSDALEVIVLVLDSVEDAAPEVESSDAGGAVSNIISRMSLDTKQELLTTLRSTNPQTLPSRPTASSSATPARAP